MAARERLSSYLRRNPLTKLSDFLDSVVQPVQRLPTSLPPGSPLRGERVRTETGSILHPVPRTEPNSGPLSAFALDDVLHSPTSSGLSSRARYLRY